MKLSLFRATRFVIILALLFLLSAVSALAQAGARIKLEGLDKLAQRATKVVQKEEKTKGGDGMVYVRCFEFKEAGGYKDSDLTEIRAQLRAPEWSKLMKVEEKDDPEENKIVEIYVYGKAEGSTVYGGMTIIATEPRELTVVNIVGPSNIKEVMKQARPAKTSR